MSDIRAWDPAAQKLGESQRELLKQVASQIIDDKLQLEPGQLDSLQAVYLINAHTWTSFAADKNDEELVDWIKVLTLCPEQYAGITHGARSPVIPIVRVLRQRGTYPSMLTSWIRLHSSNRFLPYGSLTDRLR